MKLLDSKMYMEDIRYVAECNFSWDKLRDKKILITGACGLIGSFAIDVLMKQNKFCDLNCKIYALGRNRETAKERFADYWDNPRFCFLCHDVNSPLEEHTDEDFDYMIHLECVNDIKVDKTEFAKALQVTFSSDRGKERALATIIRDDEKVEKRALFAEGVLHIHGMLFKYD